MIRAGSVFGLRQALCRPLRIELPDLPDAGCGAPILEEIRPTGRVDLGNQLRRPLEKEGRALRVAQVQPIDERGVRIGKRGTRFQLLGLVETARGL